MTPAAKEGLPAVVGELVACPFCGGTNTQVRTSSHWTGMRSEIISATVMHWCEHQPGELQSVLQVKGKTEADAITAWNRRAALSPAELGGVEGPLSYRLSMVSGVSGSLWVIGNFNDKTTAEVCAKHLLELDAKNHPEWSGRQIDVIRTTPRAAEAVTDAAELLQAYQSRFGATRPDDEDDAREWDRIEIALASLTTPSAKGE